MILRLYQPQLLILSLAPLTPFRRNINTLILLPITLRLILVHAGRLVLGGRVNSIQNQRCRPRVDELVLRAGGDDDEITGLDFLVLAVDRGLAMSRRERQDLVDGVFLLSISTAPPVKSLWMDVDPEKTLTSSPISPSTGTVISTN